MATVSFSIPEELKRRFNKAFANHNKSRLIAELMQQAIESYERQQRKVRAIDALIRLRAKQKPITDTTIRRTRQKLRKP